MEKSDTWKHLTSPSPTDRCCFNCLYLLQENNRTYCTLANIIDKEIFHQCAYSVSLYKQDILSDEFYEPGKISP